MAGETIWLADARGRELDSVFPAAVKFLKETAIMF
jgi:hypothetical protein